MCFQRHKLALCGKLVDNFLENTIYANYNNGAHNILYVNKKFYEMSLLSRKHESG